MDLSSKPKNEIIWDIVNNVYEKTNGLLSEEFINLYYKPWTVNSALSNNQDTLPFAEMLNGNWHLDLYMQYCFLYYGIGKMRRYGKWPKKNTEFEEKVDLAKEYYGYSTLKAREIIPILDKLNLWDTIKEALNKGGKGKHTQSKKKLNIDIAK